MADPPDTLAAEWPREVESLAQDSVAGLIRDAWTAESDAIVYRILEIEAAPRVRSFLGRRFQLQEADCDDCLAIAYERFAPAILARQAIRNPYAYFFKIAVNVALELKRDQKTEADLLTRIGGDELAQQGSVLLADLETDAAVALVEDAVSDVDVEPFWAVEVVRLAITRLSPGARRVAETLMYKDLAFGENGAADFDYSADETGVELDMTPGALRTAKHRAFAAIAALVPALIVELGIVPPERAETAIFPSGRGDFLDQDPGL